MGLRHGHGLLEPKPDHPSLPRHHPYQFGIDGIIYTGFGHNGPDIYNTWYAYDPSDESWEELAELAADQAAWPARSSPTTDSALP